MENTERNYKFYALWIYGFIAGFFATLTFHQVTLWLLWKAAVVPFGPYNMTATAPWGVPAVLSLALWGGVWGIVLGLLLERFKDHKNYWGKVFGFGAVFPSLVALLVVAPLKGHPLAAGWHWPLIAAIFLINGMWGIGTAVFLNLLLKLNIFRSRRPADSECRPDMLCEH